jgi:hypothetical protein
VGGFERIGEFDAKFKDVCRGQRTAGEELMQRGPLQELHGHWWLSASRGGLEPLQRHRSSLVCQRTPMVCTDGLEAVAGWTRPCTSLCWWLMTAGPADLDELDGAYRRLRPEHRHAVRSNLTLLSLIEARTGMPDPRPRRADVAALLRVAQDFSFPRTWRRTSVLRFPVAVRAWYPGPARLEFFLPQTAQTGYTKITFQGDS